MELEKYARRVRISDDSLSIMLRGCLGEREDHGFGGLGHFDGKTEKSECRENGPSLTIINAVSRLSAQML
jgi:hypothetical protein